MVEKIYAGSLVGRVCKVTEGLIDNDQGRGGGGSEHWGVCRSDLHPKADR